MMFQLENKFRRLQIFQAASIQPKGLTIAVLTESKTSVQRKEIGVTCSFNISSLDKKHKVHVSILEHNVLDEKDVYNVLQFT